MIPLVEKLKHKENTDTSKRDTQQSCVCVIFEPPDRQMYKLAKLSDRWTAHENDGSYCFVKKVHSKRYETTAVTALPTKG